MSSGQANQLVAAPCKAASHYSEFLRVLLADFLPSMAGLAPQAFLYCPSEPKDCALKLHALLQQFAWTESEVSRTPGWLLSVVED